MLENTEVKKLIRQYLPSSEFVEKEKLPDNLRQLMNNCEMLSPKLPASLNLITNIYAFLETFSFLNFRIYDPVCTRGQELPLSFLGMLFFKSGGGKDSSMNLLREHCYSSCHSLIDEDQNFMFTRENSILNESAKAFKGSIQQKYVSENMPRPISIHYGKGTLEALPSIVRSISKYSGYGAINFYIGEFLVYLDTMKDNDDIFLQGVMESYDAGSIQIKAIKSEIVTTPKVKASVNLFGASTLEYLSDNKDLKTKIKKWFANGWARRFVICMPSDAETIGRKMTPDYETSQKAIQNLKEFNNVFFSLFSYFKTIKYEDRVILFSEDAREILAFYQEICEIKRDEKIDIDNWGIATEIINRSMKIMKIAGILSLFFSPNHEKDNEISAETVLQAIYIVEYFAGHYHAFSQVPSKALHHKVYNFLKYYQGQMFSLSELTEIHGGIFADMLKRTEQETVINMIAELAERDRYTIIRERYGKTWKYGILPLTEESMPCTLSVSKHDARGFQKHVVTFDKLNLILTGDRNYSSFTFKNEYRNQENSNMTIDTLILDIDEGMNMFQAAEILKDYNYVLSTTRNHRKEKNGRVCDRFRILMKTTGEYTFADNKQYYATLKNLCDQLGITADPKCYEISRYFYPNPYSEIHTHHGTLFPLNQYIVDTEKLEVSDLIKYKPIRHTLAANPQDFESFAKNWWLENCQAGSRSTNLFRIAVWGKDSGISRHSIVELIKEFNRLAPEPLPLDELERTIFITPKVRGAI